MSSTIQELVNQLSQVNGAKFASFIYRTKGTNELARYTVLLGVSKQSLYEKDRDALVEMLPTLDGIQKEAAAEILASIEESLIKGIGNNSAYTHGAEKGDTYLHFPGITGVKLNKNDGTLHLEAVLHNKTVMESGQYKTVNSSAKTLAKNAITKLLRKGKFRQFVFPNIKIAKLNGEVLELTT